MAHKFLAESDIEEAAIEWLLQLKPYHYKHGEDIIRNHKKAILEEVFEQFLCKTYQHVPAKILEEVKQEFLFNAGTDIHQRNHAFHLKLSKGIPKTWKDKNGKPQFQHFYPVDYNEVNKNKFLVVNQFTIEGRNRRRPDLIIFINGLPIVLFEFKNLFDIDATVDNAFNQVQHYIQDIPQVFETNELTVISDGSTTLHGTFSSGMEWFASWKSVDGINMVEDDFALETLIKGLLVPERLLQYIRHYIFHEWEKGALIKKAAKYHQFFGVQYALIETLKAIKPFGDGRIGVIWHTTRSGKSITMAIYTGILRQMPELKNPTIIVQVDRFDLNKQLYEDFVAAKDLVGDVSLAENTDDLRKLLSGEGGGVIFSTIEKFRLKDIKPEEEEGPHSPLKGGQGGVPVSEEGVSVSNSVSLPERQLTLQQTGVKASVRKLLAEGKSGINENAFTKFGFLKYNPNLKQKVHDLRYAGNLPEVLLWNALKRDELGVDFHRQKPINNYVVDLFCPELMLALEIDGKSHDDGEAVVYDKRRQDELETYGIEFLRFSAQDVLQNLGGVFNIIEEYVKENKLEEKLNPIERGVYNKNKELIGLKENTPLEENTSLTPFEENTPLTPLKEDTPLTPLKEDTPLTPLKGGMRESEHPVLSTRENIIVIADECHRTQYGLLKGFANNLRRAVPNASFIGFTGTPVDTKDADTVQVFGEVIHTYDIRQATEDHAVVPIYYEPRLAKLHLGNPEIEEEAEEIIEGLGQKDRNKVMWAAVEDAAGSDERVVKIAKDILHHFTERSKTLEGKAMIVCMSRRNCVKMYDALTALDGCPETAVVMTTNIAKDPKEWKAHVRTKENTEAVKARFKDPDDALKIVIVRDMWLTGFDNPPLNTLYVDKIMSGHNLVQAINRVATVFRDKPSGLIVDYMGIGDKLRDATKKYTSSGGKGNITIDTSEAFELATELIASLKFKLPKDFNYDKWLSLSKGDQLKLVSVATNYILSDEERSKEFMLDEMKLTALVPVIKTDPHIGEIALDILFLQHVGAAVRKIKNPVTNIRKKESQIKDLIHRSIESEEVVDVFTMAGIDKFDISIINDDFLATAKEQKSGNELKLELIRKIMNEEIKLRQFKNIIKYKKLKEEVEKIISDYHNHFFDSLVALQKMREAAREMQEEDERRKVLGLTEDEEAFYEILANHKNAVGDFELIKEIVKEVTAAVKKNLQIDWYKKDDVKAQVMLAVKRVLMKKGVKLELKEILDDIMEQAEARYREWWGEVA